MTGLSHSHKAGFTFFEVLAASMIASFVAGGTLLAFVTAARITGVQNHAALSEANSLAVQTIEKYRNRVAADDVTALNSLPVRAGAPAWVLEPFDALPPGGTVLTAAKRCSRVSPAPGCGVNCYQVEVRVCWDGTSVGACPC